jgi:hypothetical protein
MIYVLIQCYFYHFNRTAMIAHCYSILLPLKHIDYFIRLVLKMCDVLLTLVSKILFISKYSEPYFTVTFTHKLVPTFLLFLQVWTAVLLCRRTPAYYARIVVKTLSTPPPAKSCAAFKNVCIHQYVQKCVYMYTVRTRFYTLFT